MKNQKTIGTMLAISLILGILLVGCGPSGPREQGYPMQDGAQAHQQGFPGRMNGPRDFQNRPDMNLTEEQRQQMRQMGPRGPQMNMTEEQRQQMKEQMTAPCKDKQVNETCTMQNPRGEMPGKCIMREETLICAGERPMPRGDISE
jgi:Spy/CpxP family protein refolding chaperone